MDFDKPVPEPKYNEVQVKITKTAICGTDIHIYNWDEWSQATIPVGMTVGHEYCGVITALGDGAKERNLKVGDRVSGEGKCAAVYSTYS